MMQTEANNLSQKDVLVFTESAAFKVKELIEEEKNPNLNLRVFITGGGCSGFQYGFTFDEKIQTRKLLAVVVHLFQLKINKVNNG